MKWERKSLLCTITFLFFSSFATTQDNGSVDHKNADVHKYLDEISEEQQEKTQILEHILKNKTGTYIDLGTGGDSIAYLLNNLEDSVPVVIIGSDINESILQSVPERHPELHPYLNQKDKDKLRLELLRMDATNMTSLDDNSIQGISASALVHEIYSYVPVKSALDQFFIEMVRVLDKEGVFVYRDPKWDDKPQQDCLVILKDPIAKFFTILFLPRFLDRVFSERTDYKGQCIKPTLYEQSHIRINFYPKDSDRTKKVTLQELINTPTSSINFTKNISIEAPRGLISEIQRHYILFLKNIFITDLIHKNFFERATVNINCLPPDKGKVLQSFVAKHDISSFIIDTSSDLFASILLEKKRFHGFIEHGLSAVILDKEKAVNYCNSLYAKGVRQNLIYIKNNTLWVDPKIALLLFQDFASGIYDFIDKKSITLPYQVLEWIKREGEEFYFYKTTDELLTYVGQLTQFCLKETNKDGYILCPISPFDIRSVSRNLYKEIVKSHMSVMDIDGNNLNVIFDKSIIHFKLMKKNKALKIYKDIIKYNPKTYKKLAEWVSNELR